LRNNTEADTGLSHLIERGKKRQHRLQAAKDITAQTRSLVADNERTLVFGTASLFIAVQLAQSTLDLAATGPEELSAIGGAQRAPLSSRALPAKTTT
jgi:Outer membrane efflux protein